jgi:hypothetical protein
LPGVFLTENGLREINALPQFIFNFALEYAVRKEKENKKHKGNQN